MPKKRVELDSLYRKIGEENLWKLVDRFYELVVEDPTLSPLFTTDMNVVRRKQFYFLSQFLGGPDLYNQEYGHPRLRLKHMPHKIDENTAVAWLKCMDDAIHTLDLPKQVKIELFNRFPQVAAHMVNSFDQN